jgi:hypothetical protein
LPPESTLTGLRWKAGHDRQISYAAASTAASADFTLTPGDPSKDIKSPCNPHVARTSARGEGQFGHAAFGDDGFD